MSEAEDKIIKGTAKILSHENCNVCPDTLGFLENKENFGIPIEYNEIKHSTDEGKQWIEKSHLQDETGNIKTPTIVKCDIYESGKEECKEITGFNESDFSNWRKKQEEKPLGEPTNADPPVA